MAGPLAGIVVLDLSRALAGPHATMMLGDLGARVIKVEQPGGDDSRHWGPPFVTAAPPPATTPAAATPPAATPPAATPASATPASATPATSTTAATVQPPSGTGILADTTPEVVSTYFLSCNRNKESVVCDLRSSDGQELMTRLVRHCDVLVENYRPGVLDRLGFSVERLHELNPALVICSITGFGHDGPDAQRPGYDQIMQGESGLMSVTGTDPEHPVRVGFSIADVLAGVNAVAGIAAALYQRAGTGKGQVVRTSLLAAMVGAHAYQGSRWTVAGEVPRASGNHHPSITPYGAFRCRDGMIQLGVANEGQWRRFAPVVGIDPDEPLYCRNQLRVAARETLVERIEAAFAAQDRAHWLARLAQAQVPAGSIRTIDEVYAWDQTRSQGLLITVGHPALGELALPGPSLRFDGEPAARHLPPPLLGEHNAAVRSWLDEADQG